MNPSAPPELPVDAAVTTAPPPGPDARSLFGEILRWMLAPLVLLWPVSFAVTYLVAQAIASAPFDHALGNHAYALARQIDTRGAATLQLSVALRDWLLHDPEDIRLFQVRAPDARLLEGSATLPLPPDPPQPGVIRFRDATLDGQVWRIAYTHVALADANPALGADVRLALVQVAETRHKRADLANDILKGVLLPQLVILPLVVMLVWLGLSRGLAPLHTLQKRIRERRPHDRSPLETAQAPLEIAPLLAAFNTLLARLDENALVQKRFIAQAAHQMKTPLAGLRMQAELALRQPMGADVRHSLEQMASGSRQAARLVTQLLALARAENDGAAHDMQAVDIDRLAREVVRDWAPWALDKRMDLGYEGQDAEPGTPPGRVMRAQPVMLREMLANLVDNAIRYTSAGGRITVRVHADAARGDAHESGVHATARLFPAVVIEVEDTGPGIPAGERAKVRERFYRILGREGDGSGLGLAIVDETVALHGGSMTIDTPACPADPLSPGTLIRLVLPVSPPDPAAIALPPGVSER
ncbi:sensor histidine kinase N-terminal domain-containing protein [Robbsia sp. Bb-Pol-6]|uniref:histidine kinase n=1 Tax=Robbsia betulipollinis TaxID=2981849 RepID=A0ABT3ZQ74_9BURK|nr:sensor histidine kinase [Robbsia betulipollinis]MCY0388690.1 sensor histidine kinase N-terminal domain-containing protein [Robbsia betulipollinis]